MSEELPKHSDPEQIGESQSDSSRTSMLRFLSKKLAVETKITEVGQDWYIVLLVECNEEQVMTPKVGIKQFGQEVTSVEVRAGIEKQLNTEAGFGGEKSRNESELIEEQDLSSRPPKLDLLKSETTTASRLNPSQVQPGAYDPVSKRLVIGSRRLGKRKCCKASTPCIGTIPIQAEFQQRFNLPSFIHVSICYAEFKEQLKIAAKKRQ